ncbi:MAG: DUF3784 domain-containing protein [Methanomassiliicoccaceae archaeon]|nr:DUF3784 domain-containing protein [Methanomassiliicoccaceae archaeon]
MRKISRDYLAYLAVAFMILGVIFISLSQGYLSFSMYPAVIFLFFGFISIYWGIYYMKKRESFDITITTSFFIRKENLEHYDTQRMIRDMGKVMMIMGIFIIAGGSVYFFIESTGTRSLILSVTWIAALAILVGFLIVCRKSKYLKEPGSSSR